MKKTYVSPLTEEVNVKVENIMLSISSDTEVDPGLQQSDERRGEWGNLWN